jgi:hypothetical protein
MAGLPFGCPAILRKYGGVCGEDVYGLHGAELQGVIRAQPTLRARFP